MVAIRGEIRAIEAACPPITTRSSTRPTPRPTFPATGTPYTSREAAFPLPWVADNKFWPSVNRIDDVCTATATCSAPACRWTSWPDPAPRKKPGSRRPGLFMVPIWRRVRDAQGDERLSRRPGDGVRDARRGDSPPTPLPLTNTMLSTPTTCRRRRRTWTAAVARIGDDVQLEHRIAAGKTAGRIAPSSCRADATG